ncbi:tonB dependent receptor (plasmid) [Phaeobacter inhibens]|nr:tonB dependent receptor [Phaeobacter inhibens]
MAHTTAHKSSILLTGLLCSTALTVFSATKGHAEDDGVLSLDPIIVKQRDADGDAADRATAVYVADAEIERAAMGDLKDLFAGIASVSVGGAIPGVDSGWGRNRIISSFDHDFGHLYSPVSKICAHPRGEICDRSSCGLSRPACFRAATARPRWSVFQ